MSAYNKDLDKITERELVYDIVERLKIGKDFSTKDTGKNKVLFKAGTYLLDLFRFILSCLPPALLLEIGKLEKHVFYIKANQLAGFGLNGIYSSIYRAYSDKLGMDISSSMMLTTDSDSTLIRICPIDIDTGELADLAVTFHNDDIITVYLKK